MKASKEVLGGQVFLPVLWYLLLLAAGLPAQTKVQVGSVDELRAAWEIVQPGHEIVLRKGLIISDDLIFAGNGTAEKPIVIRAEADGETIVQSEVKLEGDHLSLIGLRFGGDNGNVVIEGTGCRLSQCVFSDSRAAKWVRVRPGSYQVEIDHNVFENKTINLTAKSCQLLQIVVDNDNERHHVHHNLFRDIPPGDGNGYETLQLITRGNPFDPPGGHSNSLIENNLFVRCNGEAEIISVKSNGNLLRNNTFRACRGGLVLRHGDDNVVAGNYFFGEGEPGSGGVRLQGTGQIVTNNYFSDLGQYGIAMMDGTPDDLYIRVERAQIAFNTFVDCKKNMAIGLNHSKHPNGTPPRDCRVTGNVFLLRSFELSTPLIEFVQGDQPVNWVWSDNFVHGKAPRLKMEGIKWRNPRLEMNKDGIAVPTKRTPSAIITEKSADLDLLGRTREAPSTVGAIQFPVTGWENRPLEEAPSEVKKETPDYLSVVKQYAELMMKDSRDNYGDERTPLFASVLNRKTLKIDPALESVEIPGVRIRDRSITGANLIHDIDLYQILYQITAITGEKKYANEADSALAYFLENSQSEATGLFCWGEHLYWDFLSEDCGYYPDYDFHEATRWPFWDKAYQLAPEACWKFAISEWDNQINDQATGDFSRHARYSKRETFSGFDFPRYAGQMMERWADAYNRPENQNRSRKKELLTAVEVLFNRMTENQKLSRSGLLIAGRATQGDHINVVWLTSNLELARCLEEAAPVMPAELAKQMRAFALKQDRDFLNAPHKLDSIGGGFAVTLHAETGRPRTRSMNKPYTSTWSSGYGYGTHAEVANICYLRFKKLRDEHPDMAEQYRQLILKAAQQYLISSPDTSELLKPNEFSNAVELMLNGYDLTEEKKYLNRAAYFANQGIDLFLDDDCPLPKATNRNEHYESVTGGPSFMHQLLELHVAWSNNSKEKN
jgi:poly(beta-D-mannuronate) lyase